MSIQSGTRIGQARIRASRADAASCANRCAAVLASLDLQPAAMPPQAILCVRSLPDPLPGAIDGRSRHAQTRPLAWEAAMRAALRDTLQRAVRPIAGPVPPTADAVFFADPSELLACAARDAGRGLLASGWWWRHLLPALDFECVVRAWHDAPTYMPAAFDSLAATRSAMTFVRRLSPQAAARLLDTMLRAYGIESLADDVARRWASPRVARVPRALDAPGAGTGWPDPPGLAATRKPPPAPWRHIVSTQWENGDLTAEQRTFAALCIVLRRVPMLPRGRPFATALMAHLDAVTTASAPPPPDSVGTPVVTRNTIHASPLADAARSAAAPRRRPATEPPSRREAPPASRTAATTVAPAAPRRHTDPAGGVNLDVKGDLPSPSVRHPERTPADTQARPAAQHNEDSPPDIDLYTGVESEFAGAFFLLNVALDLELYSHGFTTRTELALGVWDFIELVAREVLGDEESDDPLWRLLRDLAGPVAPSDVAAACHPLEAPEREEMLRRVREHLDLALEIEDAAVFLVRRPGRAVRSPSHLDIHFPLERHPIEIRRARLDRNPGWIPAAGVHVAFHFN